jgi:hypothetical protein
VWRVAGVTGKRFKLLVQAGQDVLDEDPGLWGRRVQAALPPDVLRRISKL